MLNIPTKMVDAYEIMDAENELDWDDYMYSTTNGTWHYKKINGDAKLNGAFKIDNRDLMHRQIGTIGKCVLRIYFEDGIISLFTLFDDKIVCWDKVDGKPAICTIENLVSKGKISKNDATYLRLKYDYHPAYYANINSA